MPINIAQTSNAVSQDAEVHIPVNTEKEAKKLVTELKSKGIDCKLSAEVGGIKAFPRVSTKLAYTTDVDKINKFCKDNNLKPEYYN